MSTKNLSAVTSELIAAYGNTAKNVIDAYRAGGERLVSAMEQRWNAALKESRPQLSDEVVKNATAAQLAFSVFYSRTLIQTTQGAGKIVSQLVSLAETGVDKVAANASLFEEKTGVKTLSLLAQASAPGAEALGKLASQIEKKTAELVDRIAGDNVVTASVKRPSAFKQNRSTRTAAKAA